MEEVAENALQRVNSIIIVSTQDSSDCSDRHRRLCVSRGKRERERERERESQRGDDDENENLMKTSACMRQKMNSDQDDEGNGVRQAVDF